MNDYARSEEYTVLMFSVIEEHENLHWIRDNMRVECMRSEKEKKKTGGRFVLSECIKVNDLYRDYCPFDFLIVIYEKNCEGLTAAWIEEAYEITSESDFDTLDESIRGEVPPPLFKQWTFTFNPWNEHHWLKRRFFDSPDPDVLAVTTDYRCNEWLDESDLALFERMKQTNPRRYAVAGLGGWGIVEGLIYENWAERSFTLSEVSDCRTVCGLDFGYTNDPTALFVGFINTERRELYVWDELYETGLTNRRIYDRIASMGYAKEQITADSAEPKSIAELKEYGLRVRPAMKGRDSVSNGIQFIQDYRMIIHPRCVNFLTEVSNYTFAKDRFGKALNEPIDDFNHLMDAMRYALEGFRKPAARYHRVIGGL